MAQNFFVFPTSFAQQRLWFLDQLEPGTPTYNIPAAVRLKGKLDVAALQRCLTEIIQRHEILRTVFREVDNHPVQFVSTELSFTLATQDLRELPDEMKEFEAQRLAGEEARSPFDLATGPLLRARLLYLREKENILLLTMHHIISDGWSMGIFIREVALLYDAYSNNRSSPLPELAIQYADFAHWEKEWMQAEVVHEHLSYWKEKLAGPLSALELPVDRPRPRIRSNRGARQHFTLPAALSATVKSFTQRKQSTLFITLLTAFKALLYRYTEQKDIVVGSPTANRNQGETENLIGFFVNTLVLRTDLSCDPSFHELFERVRKTVQEAYVHQELPFERLVEELQPTRTLSETPLFQVMFIFQNAPQPLPELPGLTVSFFETDSGTSKFDLMFSILETDETLGGSIQYNTDIFEEATVKQFAEHFQVLLVAALSSPDVPLSRLPLLSESEQHQLRSSWNEPVAEPYPETCLQELFEAQVRRAPDAVAVVSESGSLTYGELDARANRLAAELRRRGVGVETLVAVCLERTPQLLVALLGILKAGGAYVPLDPRYPQERLRLMLEDAGAGYVVTQGSLRGVVKGSGRAAEIISVEEEWRNEARGIAVSSASSSAEQLAYVIYTSGSTGRPKGVMLTHASAVTLVRWAHETFSPAQLSGVLASTSICFDLSVFEIFVPLGCGGRVVLVEDVLALGRLCGRGEVTLVNTVPSAMAELLRLGAVPESVRVVNLAGEALERRLVSAIYEQLGQVQEVWNLYGPTEDTTYSTYARLQREETGTPSIGGPILKTQVYLLDSGEELVPYGVRGELYLGGTGLALGYVGQPGLTAERFRPNPFSATPGARMYRTGDLARYQWDGNLGYLGRLDQQVKVRGFRIELGEIETVLRAHPSVRECVVVAREEEGAGKYLVAYIVSRKEAEAVRSGQLREHLRQRLPEYMVPAVFVALAELPLTPNGKLDRRALPAPEQGLGAAEQEYVAPRTEIEAQVAGIWSEVLRRGPLSVHDNFFELGGHSLLATQVMAQINRVFGIELPLREMFEHPQVVSLARQVEARLRAGGGRETVPLRRVERGERVALSFAQQRLWFLDQLEPGSTAYNIPVAVRLSGELQVGALERAFNEVIRRHESLRTTFANEGGQARQLIHAPEPIKLPLIDLSGLGAAAREQQARQLVLAETLRPFDLASGPLLRVRLVRLAAAEHVVQLTMHHIIADGWSLEVLGRELGALYEAFSSGRESPLSELPIQYADFAAWQRAWLREEVLAEQLRYWQQQLSGAPALLELPTDRSRPRVQGYGGQVHRFALSAALSSSLKELSQREGVTLFMTLLAAWQVLLARYSGADDISVGTPIAGRRQVETQGLIGFFVNTLVLRTKLSGEPSFREVLQQVKEVCLAAYAHQEIPFEKLVEELQPQRELSYGPLFQVMLVLQNAPAAALALSGMQASRVEIGEQQAKFDLTLTLVESEAGISGRLEYKTELFEAATIEQLVAHLGVLLEGIVAAPEENIHRLPLLRAEERRQLLQEWNEPGRAYERAPLLHELFEQQVERSPDAIALVYQEQQLSYRELNRRANQLAHYLRGKGVGPDVLVGICVERSLEMVVALLGVLKSGGAYVPLDPTYPKERLLFMLQDTKTPVLLTEKGLIERMPCHQAKVVCLDTDWNEIAQESTRDPISGATAGNCAYVIYTSGSTGRPKGVVVDHQNVIRLFEATDNWFHFDQSDVWTFFHSYAFDFSVWELWGALLYGGRLVMVPYLVSRSPEEFYDLLCTEQVTVLNQTASAFRQLIEAEKALAAAKELALRFVIFGGEALELESLKPWFGTHTDQSPRLINMYGITETTVHVTYFPLRADVRATGSVIGVRIPDLSVYVLNQHLQPVPEKVASEIFVGGAGLGRGYLNRPELTAEKFIPNPFASKPGERLYRAGDLARYLPDGNLEYAGRVDHQVKIRGFRIELGEVEKALTAHPSVRECVVVAREDVSEGKCLVAYIVSSIEAEAVTSGELRRYLQEQLPEYMVPSVFVRLESLPLTPSGKLDRRALPAPGLAAAEQEYVAPRTEIEAQVAGIWSEVLRVSRVGAADNFFELGGHSLLATQVVAQINRVFGIELRLRELFEHPRVAELAGQVEAQLRVGGGSAAVPLRRVARGAQVALSYAQQRLWFLDQLEPGSAAYNMPVAVRLSGELQVAALERAFNEVVSRHEALRTTFEVKEWEPVQVIAAQQRLSLALISLEGFAEQQREAEVERVAALAAREPFELQHWPLFRVKLLRVNAKEHVLVLVLHHIISDGWSMGVLVRELGAFYAGFVNGRQLELPALEVQYADYAVWQREWLRGAVLEEQLRYWQGQLRGASHTLELPTREQPGDINDIRGASLRLAYDDELTAELKQLSQREGVTLFMLLLAALNTLLYRYSGQSDIVVGTGVANRSQRELKDLIGFFVNVLPLRTDLSGNPTFRELLQRVWKTALGAYAHQEMPFEKIVEELQPERTRSHSPLFRVVLVLNNMVLPAMESPSLSLSAVPVHSGTSHFDLTLTLMETEQGLRGTIEYKTALFSAALVEQLLIHYEQVLRAVIKDPEQRLLEIELAAGAAKTFAAGNLKDFAEVFANDQFSFDVG